MSLNTAREGMKRLAVESESVVNDRTLTVAQKSARLDQMKVEMQAYSEEVSLHRKSAMFAGGGSSGTAPGTAAIGVKGLRGGTNLRMSQDQESVILKGVSTKTPSRVEVGAKSAVDFTGTVPPTLSPEFIPWLTEQTRVASIIPNTPASGPAMRYVRATVAAGSGAAVVAPGALKPEAGAGISHVDSNAIKIAVQEAIYDESLRDFPNSNGLLTDILTKQVVHAENDALLNADGSAAYGGAYGILHTTGIQAGIVQAAGDYAIDTLAKADNALRTGSSYVHADAYVMHPTTWTNDFLTAKDSYGRYLLGEPAAMTAPMIWGRPVVLTTQIGLGTVLAGNFGNGAQVAYWQGLTVEAGWDGNDFTHNTTHFRCEERVHLLITRPDCFVPVTITAPKA